jgi:hemerythrin
MPVKKKVTSIEQIRDRYLLVESRNKQKKEHLDSLKTEYANLAKEVFASEQQLLKMIEAFKIQNKKVSSETKDYVDCCAQLALKEAECDYSLFLEKDFNFQLVEVI